jgi:hypothetical protein
MWEAASKQININKLQLGGKKSHRRNYQRKEGAILEGPVTEGLYEEKLCELHGRKKIFFLSLYATRTPAEGLQTTLKKTD